MNSGLPQQEPGSNWPKDSFARREIAWQLWFLWSIPVLGLFAWLVFGLGTSGNSRSVETLIVYAAQDQIYAEPILKDFEKQTGIKVRAVYDSEATKTVAIANRLLAERDHPQCDVYWGNEELRTRQLASRNIFRETNGWAAFGYRSRRMVASAAAGAPATPDSLVELTNPAYRGKIALAYPLFGTTAAHFLALRQHWGESNWLAWCRALAANKPFLVDGNSVAVKFVARNEAVIALTDSDDIAAENREGTRVKALPISGETLLIPNTVAVVRNARHPAVAQLLFEYLQTRAVTERLVQAGALEGAWAADVWSATLKPDWEAIIRDLDSATATLQKIFLR
jgi:iron(III) transport system substrate-binding protein